jgi:hypothetical protein
MTAPYCPTVLSRCADCGFGTITGGEYYMVKEEVWEAAWAGRRKPWHELPGQQVLCIGCLEKRIGRKLTANDFTDAPVNDLNDDSLRSERLINRLMTEGTNQPHDLALRRRAGAAPFGNRGKELPDLASGDDADGDGPSPVPTHRCVY